MQNNLIQFQDFQAFSSLGTIPFSFVLPMKKLRSVKTLFSFAQNNKKGGRMHKMDPENLAELFKLTES
jgi:hypothetical protein